MPSPDARPEPNGRRPSLLPLQGGKVAAEALGYVYAHRYGLGVTCLRIGWATPRPRPRSLALDLWVSPRDLAQLVTRAVRGSRPFGVYFGVSANTRRRWLIDNALAELDDRPVDDAGDHWARWRGKHGTGWRGKHGTGWRGKHSWRRVPDSVDELEMCVE